MFEALLEGAGVERVLDENVVLSEVHDNEDALWSLLVFSGYLKAEKRPRGPMEQAAHLLSIPNREVRLVYATTFRRWMATRMEGHGGSLDQVTSALLRGDAELLQKQLQSFVSNLLSDSRSWHGEPRTRLSRLRRRPARRARTRVRCAPTANRGKVVPTS